MAAKTVAEAGATAMAAAVLWQTPPQEASCAVVSEAQGPQAAQVTAVPEPPEAKKPERQTQAL